MELTELINHPERLDRETLYDLRSMLALYPYFQTARLLMLQNLFLLHDPTFNEELRRASLYITDRKTIFQMIEATHYTLRKTTAKDQKSYTNNQDTAPHSPQESRTVALIDNFLDSIPKDEEEKKQPHRRPTPADAAVDYVAYLLECEEYGENSIGDDAPQMKGQDLIDTFLQQEQGHIHLAELLPEDNEESSDTDDTDEEFFTETLARIYIRQGRYQKALDIIGRLNQQFPNKNAYFADQKRFLEKLIINNNNKQKK